MEALDSRLLVYFDTLFGLFTNSSERDLSWKCNESSVLCFADGQIRGLSHSSMISSPARPNVAFEVASGQVSETSTARFSTF